METSFLLSSESKFSMKSYFLDDRYTEHNAFYIKNLAINLKPVYANVVLVDGKL